MSAGYTHHLSSRRQQNKISAEFDFCQNRARFTQDAVALSICYRINCQLGVDCPLNIHWVYAASLKRPIFLHLCRIKLVKFILAFESWLIRFVGSPLLPTLTIHAGQTNHWVGSPSLKIQSSLRLGQPHPAFSMQTIINYLIVKYDQIIWGGNIVHKPTCCYLYTPVCDGTRIFSGTVLIFGIKFFWYLFWYFFRG